MALKAGRVGVDPKYVDATGKPVIGPDPGPTPTTDTCYKRIDLEVTDGKSSWPQAPGEMVYFVKWNGSSYILYSVMIMSASSYHLDNIRSSGSPGGVSFIYRDGKCSVENLGTMNAFIIGMDSNKPTTSSNAKVAAVTTATTTKKSTKKIAK